MLLLLLLLLLGVGVGVVVMVVEREQAELGQAGQGQAGHLPKTLFNPSTSLKTRCNYLLKKLLPRNIPVANWLHRVLRQGVTASTPFRCKCSKMASCRA